jgi:hypothetical protein
MKEMKWRNNNISLGHEVLLKFYMNTVVQGSHALVSYLQTPFGSSFVVPTYRNRAASFLALIAPEKKYGQYIKK